MNKAIEFCHMDNGGEFKTAFKDRLIELNIGRSYTVPHTPQSNSIVERSNGIIKRIFNKLIYVHANQDYSKWSEYLDKAVQIYNTKINTTIGTTPQIAANYQQQTDIDKVIENVKKKCIKPGPLQKSYALDQRVRLRIPKGKLAKFDQPNWSEIIYTITSVTQQTQNNLNNAVAKPSRYRITAIGSTVES